jgi:molecular chaperone GrpE
VTDQPAGANPRADSAAAAELPPDDDPGSVLRSIDESLRAFHQLSARREAVIDRLHEENQLLRNGLRRSILQPVVTDLARLYDGLSQQAERLAREPDRTVEHALFAGFAEDVAAALERCGVTVVTAGRGEAYERGRHLATGFVGDADPALHDTVADVLAVGLVDQENGQIRRPIRVRLYRIAVSEHLSTASAE